MLNPPNSANKISSSLLGVYMVLNLVWTNIYSFPTLNLFNISFSFFDIIFIVYIFIPVILIFLSILSVLLKKYVNAIFWVTSLFWLFLTIGELVGDKPYSPSFMSIIVTLTITVLLIIVKLISNKVMLSKTIN